MGNNYESVISKSRVRLARNIDKVNFPHMLAASNSANKKIFTAVLEGARAIYSDAVGVMMYELSAVNRTYLAESRMISRELCSNTLAGALVAADNFRVSVMINEEDHLRLQSMVDGFHLSDAYLAADKLDDEIGARLDYAYDEKLGYLTSCPTNLGTGMRAGVMMFLPALTIENKINTIIKNYNSLGLTVRGAMGEGSEAQAFMYQISNQRILGVGEKDIIAIVEKVATEIAEKELQEREAIRVKYGVKLVDKIMRTYGELKYARILNTKELMDKIGYVKLGVALGMIKIRMNDIDKVIESAQPAHIIKASGEQSNESEIDLKRAEIISAALEGK